uniref:Uncharacterized protein n=1 Tax=Ditylenchus dipsaci TaxID=166011 RepID=A0A915DU53_9BILA
MSIPPLPVNNCTTAYIMAKSSSLFVVHLMHNLINSASVILFFANLKLAVDPARKSLHFHTNLKLTLTISYTAYIYYNDDFSIIKSHCTGSSAKTAEKLSFMNHLMLGIDVIVTFGDAYLRVSINKQHKNKIDIHYNLQKAYQNRENLLSIKLIFPLSLVHSSVFLAYLVLILVVKNFINFEDAKTLKMEITSKKSARKGAEEVAADVYFQQFEKQINRMMK